MIPYGRQTIDDEDIENVVQVLRSDWVTTGPRVDEFENALAAYVGVEHAVAVSSGTAALHCAMYALGVGKGDEVIVPAITFAASANCVVFQGGTPVFIDVDPEHLLIDPDLVEAKITERTRAIVAVDYAGHPCDYDRLGEIARKHGLALVADGCHALGAEYKNRRVGSLAGLTVFSFHPVKHITTGEGGMIVTNDPDLANRLRLFRNHGINTDFRARDQKGSWYYEMVDLGYNYRITDIQCALGLSQLNKLPDFLKRRRAIAAQYDRAFGGVGDIYPLKTAEDILHAYHLYVIRIPFRAINIKRAELFTALRERGVGVNVHYIPVHLHPFYRDNFKTAPGLCPIAEEAYEEILSLPIFPGMDQRATETVIGAVLDVLQECRK
jgi:perosamine synthetase